MKIHDRVFLTAELGLAGLPPSERLLVRLRYGQDLTLEQVARVAGLGDPQRADRRIRKVLAELRRRMR